MADETPSVFAGLPVWAKAVAWVGAPVVACGFLIYFVTMTLTAKLDAIEKHLQDHETDTKTSIAVTIEQNWQMIAVVQGTCLNVAKADADRLRCRLCERPEDHANRRVHARAHRNEYNDWKRRRQKQQRRENTQRLRQMNRMRAESRA